MKVTITILLSLGLAAAYDNAAIVDTGVAAGLNGFLVEAPCGAYQEAGQICLVAAEYDKQTHNLPVGGQPTATYNVVIRVRGVVEPMTYTGGTLMSAINPHYYVGGRPSDGSYNIYSLTTPDPSQVYYFNAAPSVGHTILKLDYRVTIPMKGGTTIVVAVNGQNQQQVANFQNVTVDSVAVAQPYKRQFLQYNVISVSNKTAIIQQRIKPELELRIGRPSHMVNKRGKYFDIRGKLLPSSPSGPDMAKYFSKIYIIQREGER